MSEPLADTRCLWLLAVQTYIRYIENKVTS